MGVDRKVVLVTGGTRGIGLGIAKCLAADGCDLAINGLRDRDAVAESLDDLKQFGVDVCYCRGDVSSPEDRQRMLDTVRERFGRLHVLVNNAGITSPGRKDILEADEQSFDHVMGVNLKGPYFLTQAAANWMVDQKSTRADFAGCIVNVSSISAEFVSVNRGDYCLTKAGIGMATKLWAARLAEFDIGVYEVQPGVIQSDMTIGVVEKYDRLIADGLTLERRWGYPVDVGKAVAMLVRGDLPYATGQVLKIDGGMTIQQL
ncbi:MAG: 3-ketoacyl-ACP reductase [Planctomycetota bacterium]|nr:3-ketoacyl-ACP reductase [Planctomycetota bacterium]